MPNAWRRGPAGAARRRERPASGYATRGAPLARSPEEARKLFVDYAKREGERMGRRGAALVPLGPHGECWQNAWERVEALVPQGFEWRYCEGVVLVPTTGRDRQWIAHAWIMDWSGEVLEATEGYERAIEYRGWRFQLDSIVAATQDWEPGVPRSSIVEAALANGIAPEQAVYWLRIPPARA